MCGNVADKIQNYTDTGIGAVSGLVLYKYGQKAVIKPYVKAVENSFQLSPQKNNLYKDAVQKAFESSKLNNEVNIIYIDEKNIYEQKHKIYDYLQIKEPYKKSKNPIKMIWKWIFGNKLENVSNRINSVAKGENAFCASYRPMLYKIAPILFPEFKDCKSIVVVNKDKMASTAFHELGHAMNFYNGKIARILQICGGFVAGKLSVLLLLSALFTNKTNEKQKNNNLQKQDKNNKSIAQFIKNNCGLLVSACFMPTIIEEGFASINASKLAKSVLDKQAYRNLNKMNFKAWTSYVFCAAVAGTLAHFAVKLRDKIVER